MTSATRDGTSGAGDAGGAGAGGTVAWVESPLQLLAAAEWADAAGIRIDVAFRLTSPHMTATARELLDRGARFATCVPYLGIPWRLLTLARRWLAGDGFSGQFRLAAAALAPGRVTLLDDGALTMPLADAIVGARAFARPHVREGRIAASLGRVAGERLRRLAERERLEAFTVYADRPELAGLAALGAEVRANDFAWTRRTARPIELPARRVLLGSALPVDGRMRARDYLAWVRRTASEGDVAYLPHRREPAEQLEAVRAVAGVHVVAASVPVELALAGLAGVEVVGLPSTALDTLPLVLGSRARVRPVPAG
jgi:hypothetical protein